MRIARAAALLIAIVSGCGQLPSPSPSVTPSGSTATVPPVEVSQPPATAAPGTPDSPSTVLDHGIIPESDATLFVTTDGESIVFSAADRGAADPELAPDLYRVVPGGSPTRIFSNPRRDSNLIPVAAGGGYVAFGEGNLEAFGEKGWVLWLLPPGASEPIELDRNPPDNNAALPLVAVNDGYVAWQAIGFGPELERAELVAVSLPDMTRRTIKSANPSDYQWWTPGLDGDRLVYTEVDYAHGDATSPSQPANLHVMLLDLADATAQPRRLDTSGRAVEPALRGDTVVWKEADNVFGWGTMVLHELSSGSTRTLPVSPQSAIDSPSIGSRYLAYWGIDDTEFYLYDRKRDAVAEVFTIAPDSTIGGAFRAEVVGDLLVWVQGTETGSVVAWARLPTMDDP